MKILYVFRSLAVWGGIERILIGKMNSLAASGYDVYMLTSDQAGHPVPYRLSAAVRLEDLGISFHRQYRHRGLRRLWEGYRLKRLYEQRLAEKIRLIRPDVIVSVATSRLDAVAKVKGAVPLVVESHSNCGRTLHSGRLLGCYYDWQLKRALRRAAVIVALTEGDADAWRSHGYSPVRVIPNMVQLPPPPPALPEEADTSRRVIFVGRFDYQKQPLEAIRIWQMVQPQFPDWQLDIYGTGEQQQQVEAAVRQSGCRITLHAPTDRIFDCYRASRILMLTSLFEPFGLVLPEAMGCGLPVVAYDCPYGPSAIITDGTDGFLVSPGDTQAFARRLSQLMGDDALRARMGKAATAVADRYAPETVMPQWKQLFEAVQHGE